MHYTVIAAHVDSTSRTVNFFTFHCRRVPNPGELVSLPGGTVVMVDRVSHIATRVTEELNVMSPVLTLRDLREEERAANEGHIKLLAHEDRAAAIDVIVKKATSFWLDFDDEDEEEDQE